MRSCDLRVQHKVDQSLEGSTPSCGITRIVDKNISYSTGDKERLEEFAKKIWYADDGGGGGTLDQLLAWWQDLQKSGPLFGYFPKASKTWLIVKPGNRN